MNRKVRVCPTQLILPELPQGGQRPSQNMERSPLPRFDASSLLQGIRAIVSACRFPQRCLDPVSFGLT
jgi:hypothetical protein